MASSTKDIVFGLTFCIYLALTAIFGSIFIMAPALPLMYFNEKLFRWFMDLVIPLWLILPGSIFEMLCGTKIFITGDQVNSKNSSLILMNHRCRLDWMFYWMIHLRTGRLNNLKIVMKKDLKNIPIFGWCMQNLLYFFLCRHWDTDYIYLERMLDYFIDLKYPLQLFIFPEGTNMCRRGKVMSDTFAAKNGLPKYEYVLHPHVKGFNYLMQRLRHNVIDSIHDVTIGYPKNLCYGEKDLLRGNFPLEIHVHFKCYKVSDIPVDSDALDEWCKERWREKEERLKQFYQYGKFVGSPIHYCDKNSKAKYSSIMGLLILFWIVFLLVCSYFIWCYNAIRWYSFFVILFYGIVSYCGGMDNLQLYLHGNLSK